MTVAVVIVTWNSGAELEKCLECLERQEKRADRIIIVDNASTRGTLEHCVARWPAVEVFRLGYNSGFACAANFGITSAQDCEFVALVNPDAFSKPSWLQNLMWAAEHYPEYAAYGSKLLQTAQTKLLDGTGDVYHVSGRVWRKNHGRSVESENFDTAEIFSACAAAALYRRQVLIEVGGFDEEYFCYSEDIDLGFRVRLAGYRCLYVPSAIAYHIGSVAAGRHSSFYVYYGHRNLVWTYFKNMPWPLLLVYLPQHLLLNVASIVYFSLRGEGRTILKAKWDAIKGLPRIVRERRKVQSRRRVGAWKLWRVMERGLLAPYKRRA